MDGYPDFNATFSDGSTYGIGTLDGTVTSGSTLTATLTFTTNGNTSITGNWSLSYEALSDHQLFAQRDQRQLHRHRYRGRHRHLHPWRHEWTDCLERLCADGLGLHQRQHD